MDLTPETLRSATFRDKLRGYHPDDVDEFLESVARGLEVLLARLRDASEKARAVAPPERPTNNDEAVKTLALAQRTADLAIHEAKAEAERLVKAAEQRARRVVSDAEESAAQLAETAQAELRADLERLQAARDQLFGEVQSLGSWLEGERGRIRRALVELADRVDNVREAGDAPVPKSVSLPAPPRQKLETEHTTAAKAEPPPKRPAPAEPAVEHARAVISPPIERPKAAPPSAAPAPNPRSTPPRGQQPVRATGDDAVFSRAQEGIAPPAAPVDDDDDPFFRELRAAMLDQSPLGPRDDDQNEDSAASQ